MTLFHLAPVSSADISDVSEVDCAPQGKYKWKPPFLISCVLQVAKGGLVETKPKVAHE